jgi:hypothetical protein
MKTKLINLPFKPEPRSKTLVQRIKEQEQQTKRKKRAVVALPFNPQVGAGADMRRNDCGPACIRMAFDFLGAAQGVTIDQLAALIDPEDDGTTENELISLATRYGVNASVQYAQPNQLPEPPAIVLIRYSGFNRDTVQDKRYWDLAASNPNVLHWAWWLGNANINGQNVSVWNDPLYTGSGGKNVIHTLDELERAYVNYFGSRVAIKFAGIFNPPTTTLIVTPRDADGVNLRRSPELRADNLIRRLAFGTRLTVLEDADGARVKMNSGSQIYWLRVQTPENEIGFVAAWLVVPSLAPPSATVKTNVVVAKGGINIRRDASTNHPPIWTVADGAPLRVLPSNGNDWHLKIGNPANWLEVETYSFKRGFVRCDVIGLPDKTDNRVPVDDNLLKYGDSAWLYGVHDDFAHKRGEIFGGRKGWVLFTEDVGGNGASPVKDWANPNVGFGTLVRLNNGYNDGYRGPGTIPEPHRYDEFAGKCAAWVQRTMSGLSSDYTATFVIGNEMNNPREWPNPNGNSNTINFGAAITPQGYADCFNRVYRAVKNIAPNVRVVPGAVDPYNAQYMDCLTYFTQMLARIDNLDGFAFHTYTHGHDVNLITSLQTFKADPLRWQYYDFRSYVTLIDHLPAKWRDKPIFITESDQTDPAWTGGRNGWVRAAYEEINRWNTQPFAPQICALILYRWHRGGGSDAQFCLQDKPDICADFRDTIAQTDLRWRSSLGVAKTLRQTNRTLRKKVTPKKVKKKKVKRSLKKSR